MAHWRDSARVPRFYFISGYAAFPLILFLLHIRWWTLAVAILATGFFTFLERYGFTVRVFLRWLRNVIGGNRKIANPWWR
jgi:intracellular multiplication protein IcmT